MYRTMGPASSSALVYYAEEENWMEYWVRKDQDERRYGQRSHQQHQLAYEA